MPLSLYPASVSSTLQGLPGGVDAIRATLKAMVRYARQYKQDVGIGTLARQLVDAIPQKDRVGEAMTLQRFVRDSVNFRGDPQGVEMVQTPPRTLEIRAGDCDDKSTLLAALLGSIGFSTRFKAIGLRGGPYTHVLCEVKMGTRWLPCETIVDGKEIGWLPDDITREMVAHV